jgi:hypothetical protein
MKICIHPLPPIAYSAIPSTPLHHSYIVTLTCPNILPMGNFLAHSATTLNLFKFYSFSVIYLDHLTEHYSFLHDHIWFLSLALLFHGTYYLLTYYIFSNLYSMFLSFVPKLQ